MTTSEQDVVREDSMLEQAWNIIANVNWETGQVQSPEDWKKAAVSFREQYHQWLNDKYNPNQTERPEDAAHRLAGRLQRIQLVLNDFPPETIRKITKGEYTEGSLPAVVVALLKELREFHNRVKQLRQVWEVQADHGNWNASENQHAFFRGLELSMAIIEGREVHYRSKPQTGYLEETHPYAGSEQAPSVHMYKANSLAGDSLLQEGVEKHD